MQLLFYLRRYEIVLSTRSVFKTLASCRRANIMVFEFMIISISIASTEATVNLKLYLIIVVIISFTWFCKIFRNQRSLDWNVSDNAFIYN